jgi:hypothetical protein
MSSSDLPYPARGNQEVKSLLPHKHTRQNGVVLTGRTGVELCAQLNKPPQPTPCSSLGKSLSSIVSEYPKPE